MRSGRTSRDGMKKWGVLRAMAGGGVLAVKVLLQDGDMIWRKGRERYDTHSTQ